MLTINEICDRISMRYDPDEVVEMLEISTDDLLDRFDHKVIELYSKLNEELQDDY